MAYPSFFCSTPWLTAAAAMESASDLAVLQLCDGDGVVGLMPLVRRSNRLGGSDLRPLGADFYPDPVGVICDVRLRPALIRLIRTYVESGSLHCDRMSLVWMHKDEAALWADHVQKMTLAPYLELPATFDYLMQGFKKKRRYNLNASVSRFVEAGGRFLQCNDVTGKERLLDDLFELHATRSEQRRIESLIATSRAKTFHRRLAVEAPEARLYALLLDGRTIAVLYGFEFCGNFMYYQIAHDPAFSSFGPGGVLLYLVIKDCCERGIREFNFLQGDEAYKRSWTKTSRDLYSAMVIGGSSRAKLLAALHSLKKTLSSSIGRTMEAASGQVKK
jgi:CelD/BcsL family acetyltransferase involved in cellulose biosynthesis